MMMMLMKNFSGLVWFYINHCRLFYTKSCLYIHTHTHTYIYIYIYMICFGWVLRPINYCRLFNAKSGLYIYIIYI